MPMISSEVIEFTLPSPPGGKDEIFQIQHKSFPDFINDLGGVTYRPISYACSYWVFHLGLAAEVDTRSLSDDEVKQLLEFFTSKHTWAWMETLCSIRGINLMNLNICGSWHALLTCL